MISLDNLVDTVLNITVFVFIGMLIWLYLKEVPGSQGSKKDGTGESH